MDHGLANLLLRILSATQLNNLQMIYNKNLRVLSDHVPSKFSSIHLGQPWFNTKTKRAVRHKKRVYIKRARHTGNRSCESQLIVTLHNLAKSLDEKSQVDVILLDFEKAFDKWAIATFFTKQSFTVSMETS